jgi:hypothetical protein
MPNDLQKKLDAAKNLASATIRSNAANKMAYGTSKISSRATFVADQAKAKADLAKNQALNNNDFKNQPALNAKANVLQSMKYGTNTAKVNSNAMKVEANKAKVEANKAKVEANKAYITNKKS